MVSRMTEQYKVHLTSAQGSLQSRDLEHKLEIQRLQEKIHALEVLLTEQGAPSLPSVGMSQQAPSSSALQDEVFNVIPGMVNQHQGATQYNSQDQAFSFQKQVSLNLDQAQILVQLHLWILNYGLNPRLHIESHHPTKPSM